MASQQSFRFLELPLELREMVYDFYIPTYHVIDSGNFGIVLASHNVKPLLVVNKQIRSELSPKVKKTMKGFAHGDRKFYNMSDLPSTVLERTATLELHKWRGSGTTRRGAMDFSTMPWLTAVVCQIPENLKAGFSFACDSESIPYSKLLSHLLHPSDWTLPGDWNDYWTALKTDYVASRFTDIALKVNKARETGKDINFLLAVTGETESQGATRSGGVKKRHWVRLVSIPRVTDR